MTLLYILYILVALIITLLVIGLFLPAEYHVEKTIIIQKPVAWVMDKVANLHYYAEWNPWQKPDTTAKKEITGTPKSPGHKYSWQGKKVGMGSLTLRDIDSKHVHFDLQFIKPWKAEANDNWLFEEWGTGETKVTWQNDGDLPYPMARLMGPTLNKTLNRQFVEGLNNLKKLCES
jgi:Polyketide cyclase / dehydrase and lipid transport